jgi:hypothetical protein
MRWMVSPTSATRMDCLSVRNGEAVDPALVSTPVGPAVMAVTVTTSVAVTTPALVANRSVRGPSGAPWGTETLSTRPTSEPPVCGRTVKSPRSKSAALAKPPLARVMVMVTLIWPCRTEGLGTTTTPSTGSAGASKLNETSGPAAAVSTAAIPRSMVVLASTGADGASAMDASAIALSALGTLASGTTEGPSATGPASATFLNSLVVLS